MVLVVEEDLDLEEVVEMIVEEAVLEGEEGTIVGVGVDLVEVQKLSI